jgi:3'(2'), 5'-bisphosphate nucleotidase
VIDPAILDVARRAVRAASRVCLDVLAGTPSTPDAMAKLGREPVTVADYGSQAVILEAVSAAFPDHRVIAEEGSEHFAEHAGEGAAEQIVGLVGGALGRPVSLEDVLGWIDHSGDVHSITWAIDPIDGTKGFLRRDQFAVAVGVLVDGVPAAGVLGCPHFPVDPVSPDGERGVLYWALTEGGAFAEPLRGGTARPISVSDTYVADAVRVLGSVESAHGDPALVKAVITEAGLGGGMVRIDSQVKYGAVADGLAEVYLRPRNRPEYRERIWDHAAGAAIVTAAGGMVTDLDGAPLDFTRGARLEENRGVLATNGRVHDGLLGALALVEGRSPRPS